MTGLKVLAYNVWGMPRQVGGQNKSVRIPAIASLLKARKEEFDIILLSELWYEADHGIIKKAMDEAGMFMTNWGDFNSSLSPGYSSGLAIISRQTPDGVTPLFFKNRGHFCHFDGEWVARKGACHVFFQALSIGTETVSADVVVTHLIGDRFDSHGQDSNEAIRLKQASELISYIGKFNSDLTILGGTSTQNQVMVLTKCLRLQTSKIPEFNTIQRLSASGPFPTQRIPTQTVPR